jgi:NAD(P)-dependent dehydrogenase (short-subunit alcohol dehydrogenase family)
MTRWEGFVGRTALVTGTGGGIGLQIAPELPAAGATVASIDVKDRPEALEDAVSSGRGAWPCRDRVRPGAVDGAPP